MSNDLEDDARFLYNEFANCLRDQGEIIPIWDREVCEISGSETLAWMEFARIQRRRTFKFEQRIWFLEERQRRRDRYYQQQSLRVKNMLDVWKRRIFG